MLSTTSARRPKRPILARPVRDDGDSVQAGDAAIIMRAGGDIEILIPKDAVITGRDMTGPEVFVCAIGCRMVSDSEFMDDMIEWMNEEFQQTGKQA